MTFLLFIRVYWDGPQKPMYAHLDHLCIIGDMYSMMNAERTMVAYLDCPGNGHPDLDGDRHMETRERRPRISNHRISMKGTAHPHRPVMLIF
ncbi:hypothetical protein WG66_002093 [Moniliophthora roreri]|nr:hypothetical protein WG66_002093 [Moniliophthora roreri]